MRKILLSILLFCSLSIQAATVTITISAAHVTRFNAAVGRAMDLRDAQGVRRDATNEESRQFLIRYMKLFVKQQEAQPAAEAAAAAVTEIDPT